MKKLSHLLLLFFLAGALGLSGCTKKVEPPQPEEKKQETAVKKAPKKKIPDPVISDLPQSDSLDQSFSRGMNVESGSLNGTLPSPEDGRTPQQKSSALLEEALARAENATPESLKQAEEARKKAQRALDKANAPKKSKAYRAELERAMNDAAAAIAGLDGAEGEKGSYKAPLEESGNLIPELDVIYFDFDRSTLRDDVKKVIQKNFEWILRNPKVQIQLEGHCDERGSNEYNLALGEQRTRAVFEYLLSLGANPEQFTSISFGEERPMAPEHTSEAWKKNRRVEFTRF